MNGETAIMEKLNALRRQPEPTGDALENSEETAQAGTAGTQGGAASSLTGMLLAAAKDVLDWALDFILIGEIPFIGQIPGILFTAFLIYHLWQKGLFKQKGIRRVLSFAGFAVDNLPLVNNLPLGIISTWILRLPKSRQ